MNAMIKRLLWSIWVVMFATACLPMIETKPAAESEPGQSVTTPELPASPSPDVYPPLPTPTHTLPPYPWPTATPEPPAPPEPTEIPTETPPPVPTLPPTPVMTLFPTAAPPYIAFPEGTAAQPFTLYYRDGDVIRSLSSAAGAEPQLFIDPLAEFGLYLPPEQRRIPDWGVLSPDGQTLALVLTDDPVSKGPQGANDWFSPAPHPVSIYLMDMLTRELRLIVPEGMIPVWSPDGGQLAYRSTRTVGLWVVDVMTGEAKEAYAVSDEHFVSQFAWSSDSRRLSVVDILLHYTTELFIVEAAGQRPPQALIPGRTNGLSLAQWAPAGQELALRMTGEGRQPLYDLWLINADGTGARQMTHDLGVLGGLPQWSPDGKWIAFSAYADYEAEYSSYDLWLIEPVSAKLQRLTYDWTAGIDDDTVNDSMPVWSPDGTQLVYFKSSHQLWLLSLIDGGRRQLLQSDDILFDSGIIIAP